MNLEVKRFVPIADFLSEVMGQHTEIIVHDFTNYEQSIVHIINGHISNRSIGDSITDLVLDFLLSESKGDKQCICNYTSKTAQGNIFYSSTFFIKNEDKEVVGALCFNSDYQELNNSLSLLTSLLPNFSGGISLTTKDVDGVKENLNSTPQDMAINKIDSIIDGYGVSPSRMNTDEKTEVISRLNEAGVFNLRGAVQKISAKLQMSEPSVYRYIKKTRS